MLCYALTPLFKEESPQRMEEDAMKQCKEPASIIDQAVVCVPSLVSPGGGSVLAPSARGDLS